MASKYPNSGLLSDNGSKTADTPKAPDKRGHADVVCPHCGVETHYWLDGWNRVSARGPFVSLSVKAAPTYAAPEPKVAATVAAAPVSSGAKQVDDFDQDIPF